MKTDVDHKAIIEVVSQVLKNDDWELVQLQEHTDLRNYNLSSITAVELIVAVEERFGIFVPEDDLSIENVNTIDKLKRLILKNMTN
ncbi:Phosphopantetheine attachment site [Paenibacillus sophorae]|uniref:Acyl carrier protein n=1 Tax=Paenibacillus sophorae TaxID=1333845 RepID=A0A1H8UFC9_9BACL|nr:acyl carrier protein [Paenibacillus sophorae]QWU13148.1 acyl carrier protein [Paenibacillus sophorae]SEP01905.1 Phosphopantetheine attachment site [Paenibacillus sophorae]